MNIRLRQDAIVRLLRRSGTATVSQLAEEIGASRRTVLRDICALRDQGFVIHSEAGRGGGLQLDSQAPQSVARLTVTEVFALIVSVASMRAARTLPFPISPIPGLRKSKRRCCPKRYATCAGFSTASMSGSFRPTRIYRTWAPWSPPCWPRSRRRFSSVCRFDFATVMPRAWKPLATSSRKPCSSFPRCGIWWRGIRPGTISATFAWTESAGPRSWKARRSAGGTCPSKTMYARSARWHVDGFMQPRALPRRSAERAWVNSADEGSVSKQSVSMSIWYSARCQERC